MKFILVNRGWRSFEVGATELNKRQWLFDGHEGDFAAIEAASIYGMMMMIAGQGRKDVSDDLGSEQ